MLIICSGPDTYHARRKAQELVAAFRAKYDPAGYSTEVIQQKDVNDVLNRLGAPSLFAQKRMIRCDGLLDDIKIADVRNLAKRLEADADQAILVTVEDEPISSKHEKEFEKVKIVTYPYPLLVGSKFDAAVRARAQELGVPSNLAAQIARNTEGNMWLADQELQKCSANPDAPLIQSGDVEASIFEAAESFITMKNGWRRDVDSLEEPEAAPSVFLSQARTFARVKDGETGDIHPYAARKFSAMRTHASRAASSLLSALRVFTSSRNGVSSSGEEDILF